MKKVIVAIALLLSLASYQNVESSPYPVVVQKAARYVGKSNPTGTQGSWCADFACFVYGKDLPVQPSRSAKELWNRFQKSGRSVRKPQPGDLIFFWRKNPKAWQGHVGIVESVNDKFVTTIEGNVSNRVQRRQYELGSVDRLLGYGRVP